MNSRLTRLRLREQHHQIFEQLQKNRYLQFLQTLLQQQVSLQQLSSSPFQTISNKPTQHQQQINNSSLYEVTTQQLAQLIYQLNVQKHKLSRVNEQQVYNEYAENIINKILQTNQKITKLKQFYLYCKYLKRSTVQLQNDIEKYFQYERKQSTIRQQLEAYLLSSNSYVSDIIFREYLKTYNVNIFTSDLIAHYFHLNNKGLLVSNNNNNNNTNNNNNNINKQSQQQLIFQPQRIPELCLLQKSNIVFKQLYQINEKYSNLIETNQSCYVYHLVELLARMQQQQQQQANNNKNSINNLNKQNHQTQKQQYKYQTQSEIINQHHNSQQKQPSSSKNNKPHYKTTKKVNVLEDYNLLINQKLQNLNFLINKMSLMGTNLNQNIQNNLHTPKIVNQYHQNYTVITKCIRIRNKSYKNNNYNKNNNNNNQQKNNNNQQKNNKSINNNNNSNNNNPVYKNFILSIFSNNSNHQYQNDQKQSLSAFFQQNLIVDNNQQYHSLRSQQKQQQQQKKQQQQSKQQQKLRQSYQKSSQRQQYNSQYNKQQQSSQKPNHKFQFLQNKIIKTQTIIVLNKIFSTLNIFSYIYQQINPKSIQQTQYHFTPLNKHIERDYEGEFIQYNIQESGEGDNNRRQIKTTTTTQQQMMMTTQSKMKNINNNTIMKQYYHSPSHKSHYNVFIQTDNNGNWILMTGNKKLLYPSAIFGLIQTISYMSEVATILQNKCLYSPQLMLQILSLKAQQISKIGQAIVNIFNTIKSKQVSSYSILSQYLIVSLKGLLNWQLDWVSRLDLTKQQHQMFNNQIQSIILTQSNNQFYINQQQSRRNKDYDYNKQLDTLINHHHHNNQQQQQQQQYIQQKHRIQQQIKQAKISKYLTYYANKAKKTDYLSQIIYELDANYDIHPVIQQLLISQQYHHNTFYYFDNILFYQTVLYQIIQMRNHIKLDHYYTLPRLHSAFGFFTTRALSFGDILGQLAKLYVNSIKVQQLLMFFKTQLRLKRIVFKGELHWLSYKSFVESSKQKTFKDFVQQQGSEIFALVQQPLEYFLINIKDFTRKVNLFEQEIQKFKYYQDLLGKLSYSKVKIKNLDSYLNILTNQQLSQLTSVLHYFNPITIILKHQQPSQQLFVDLKKTIQTNNKIKLEDISRNTIMLEQRQKLSQIIFYNKSFGFQLSYNDCFNMFVQNNKKAHTLISDSQSLKLLINRQKPNIIKHYNDLLSQQKPHLYLALSFYNHLLILSLLLAKDQLIDSDDKQIIQQLIINFSFPNNVMREILEIYQIFSHNQYDDKHNTEIYMLLKMKKCLHRLVKLVDSTKHDIQGLIVYNNNQVIENICLISKLSTYTQKKVIQKIQKVNQQITIKDITSNKKKEQQLQLLNNKFLAYFLVLLKNNLNSYQTQNHQMIFQPQKDNNCKQRKSHIGFGLNFTTIEQAMYQVQALLLHRILTLSKLQSSLYKNKQQLRLFDSLSGYQIKQDTLQNTQNTRKKQMLRRNDRKLIKKGVFSPVHSPQSAQHNIMQNIQKRVAIQMIKQSMTLRKIISQLELQQKKMRDQISWQTSKLQHNVIKKINAFIAQSNIDQQQSYINFKYTVNLETIKGMQNVIKEQTELAYKATKGNVFIRKVSDGQVLGKINNSGDDNKGEQKKSQLQQKQDVVNNQKNQTIQQMQQQKQQNDFFITNPTTKHLNNPFKHQPTKQQSQLQQQAQSLLSTQNTRMLTTNIDSIFNHLKKIKVFAAWKKINRNMDMANQQWRKFNNNVASILHNQQNMKRVQVINQKRGECFKENILCSLLKEENRILSQKIKYSKMESLNKTVQRYRMKLLVEEDHSKSKSNKKG